MELQIDTRRYRKEGIRVGRDNREVARFRNASFFIYNLKGEADGVEYEMKLPAPWTGFRYRLRRGPLEVASAKKVFREHAFEPERPLIRHLVVEFALDVGGRHALWTPEDRHGLVYVLREGEEIRGRLVLRSYEAQQSDPWQGDLTAPQEWSAAHAAFVAWLAAEGRSAMAS